MKVINEKINEAQKVYDTESKELDSQLAKTIKEAKDSNKQAQTDLVEKHVNNILGKII